MNPWAVLAILFVIIYVVETIADAIRSRPADRCRPDECECSICKGSSPSA